MAAPARIWTASTAGKCHVGFDTPSLNYTNEYIRADIVPDPAAIREAALREAAADLWEKHIAYMTGKGRDPGDYTSQFSLAHDAILALIEKEPKK